METKTVLFVCVENSCRSLMAEAIFNAHPPQGWRAISAGTEPASEANPRVQRMLEEIGLETPSHRPTLLTNEMMTESRVRITMGCLDSASCPAKLKTIEVTDWALQDPAKLDDEGFRRVRHEIRQRVEGLARDIALRERVRPRFGPRSRLT
jgi:arsenate reductase (thioredoxin)